MQSRLTVTTLEARDNPSIPIGLADVPVLISELDLPEIGPGYVETHTITKSLTHTITLDQFGSGSDGTFVLDIVGETHPRDEASGAGGDVTGATGLLTTDVSYHLHVGGQYADGVFTATNQSYTETGSTTETHAYTIDTGEETAIFDGNVTNTWDVSWSGTVTDGVLSFESFSNVESSETNWHWRADAPGEFYDHTVNTGFEITETGSGSEESYTGREWWEEHSHEHIAPDDYYYDDVWENPLNGTAPLDTTPLEYEIVWNAAEATATNYTWHGETEIGGSLTEAATWTDGVLDVNSFNSTSHFGDESHLIEDEPGVPESGSGTENSHRDETDTYTNDTSGSGSYVDGHADADYHAAEAATFFAHNVYTVNNEESSGVDEYGEPYTMVFNSSSDQTANGSYSNSHDYHDGDDGVRLVNSEYSFTEGSSANYQWWGTMDGVAFNESSTGTEGRSDSFSIPGDNVPITDPIALQDVYPLVAKDSSYFLVEYQGPSMPSPPTLPPLGPRGLPGWYNRHVQRIGEDAKLKVTKSMAQLWVMEEMDLKWTTNQTPKMTDKFTYPNKGGTFAQGMKRWSEYQDEVKKAEKFITVLRGSDKTSWEACFSRDRRGFCQSLLRRTVV